MIISDIMNVIVTSKKAILDIRNYIDIRNAFSDIRNNKCNPLKSVYWYQELTFQIVTTEFLI